MNVIERVKQIILKPKSEWIVIDQENTTTNELITKYLVPLALISALASFVGFSVFAKIHSLSLGIKYGVMNFVVYLAGAYLTAWIIDSLASSFGSVRDFRKALQLVVYSYTPMMVAAVVLIFPSLNWIVSLAGIYSLYILYLGFKPLMKTPDDKVTIYFVVSLVVLIIVYFVLMTVLTRLIIGNPLSIATGM